MAGYDFGDGRGPVAAHRHKNPDGSVGGWVADTAMVDDAAYIGPSAEVFGEAYVGSGARIFGHARVYDDAKVLDRALVFGRAQAFDRALISGNARIFENAGVYGEAFVGMEAEVRGSARVSGYAQINGSAIIEGAACVYGNAMIAGTSRVSEEARVFGSAVLIGDTRVLRKARVGWGDWRNETISRSPMKLNDLCLAGLDVDALSKLAVTWGLVESVDALGTMPEAERALLLNLARDLAATDPGTSDLPVDDCAVAVQRADTEVGGQAACA